MSIKSITEEKMEKVAMLLNIGEEYGCDPLIAELDDQLFNHLKKTLQEGNYLEKAKLLQNLQYWKSRLDLYLEYPFLVGKTIVGIINGGKHQSYKFYKEILNLSKEEAEVYKENQGIPTILIPDDQIIKYTVKNKYHKQQEIDLKDIRLINTLSWKDNIDVRQFLNHVTISTKSEYKNIIFIDFPTHYIHQKIENQIMMQLCDAIFVNATEGAEYQRELKQIIYLNYPKLININVGQYEEFLQYFTKIMPQRDRFHINIKLFSIDEIKRQLLELNQPKSYVSFKDELLIQLLRLEKFYLEESEKTKKLILKFNKDIILWSKEDYALESLKIMRNNLKADHFKAKELLKKHQSLRHQIMTIFSEIEQLYFKQLENEILKYKSHYLQNYEKNLWLDLAMLLIELDELSLAKIYIDRLNKMKDERVFVIYLMISEKQGHAYEQTHLDKLKLSLNQDQFIIRAKIKYRKEIGISDQEAGQLALKIDYLESADEFYLKGIMLIKNDFKKGIKMMKYAFERGHMEAGQYLFRLYNNPSVDTFGLDLNYLSNNMLPEAVLEVARNFMSLGKFTQGIIHYKLAIVLGSQEALMELASMRYEQTDYLGAIPLYELIINKSQKINAEVYERLGICYYETQNYEDALEIFKKAKTGLAYFYLGYMYEYELGTLKNLNLALDNYEKSKRLGYEQGEKSYLDLKYKIDNERNNIQSQNTYTSTKDYSTKTVTSTSNSNDSWCFLTTAVCLALDKGDNCEELQVIRHYRDEHLIYDQDGEALICEYYQMAPQIIKCINLQANHLDIYLQLYHKYIKNIYLYLKLKKYSQAKKLYVQMVKELYQIYDLEDIANEVRKTFK